MSQPQTLLITGASGLVGKVLIDTAQADYTLKFLTTNKQLAQEKNYFYWRPEEGIIDTAAFEAVDAIIHLAGAGISDKRWTSNRKKQIIDSRVESLHLIYNVLNSTPHRVKHLISAGGVGWYGNDATYQHTFTETDSCDTHSFLGIVCKQWEAAAYNFESLGLKVAVLRTGMVLSDAGGALKPIKQSMALPIIPLFGNGKQNVSWIHVADLANMYIHLVKNNLSGSYNAVADQVMRHKDMMHTFARYKKGNFFWSIPIPSFVMKVALGQLAKELLLFNTAVANTKIKETGFLFDYPVLNQHCLKTLF